MTKEEILTMKVGEELSRAVTETIFQECWHEPAEDIYDRRCYKCRSYDCENKPYSTDILGAWLVVEEMPRPFQIHRCLDNTWWAVFGFYTRIKPHIVADAAPEAICKAALLAKLGAEK